jgi:hypothetical protein
VPVPASKRKNPATDALGRKGGLKGGPAQAAKLTSEQRSESARGAVQSRRAKANSAAADTSDDALLALLNRLKAASDPAEVRRLSNRIERVIFHKQYKNT